MGLRKSYPIGKLTATPLLLAQSPAQDALALPVPAADSLGTILSPPFLKRQLE